jgi:NADH:ubiquinone oxidoreductase subunit E
VSEDRAKLAEVAAKLRIGGYHRHVFLCIGGTCCPSKVGEEAWEALKQELKDRGLTPGTDASACYRTKVGCLRVCQDGPVVVVYPEGTVFARNPLPAPPATDSSA